MATHKVPQDVEAEDKIVGFLSLKQLIFTIVGLAFGYLTYFFFTKVHPVSALLWLPFTLMFLVLGLYQRKDQPVEVYLASAIGYYFKPRVRIWGQEGYEERVKITAPPVVEKHLTKDFSGDEAVSRLSGLSLMMDSRGWASKQPYDWQNPQFAHYATDSDRLIAVHDIAQSQPASIDVYTQPSDPYDERNTINQKFDARLNIADTSMRQHAVNVAQKRDQPLELSHPNPQPLPVHRLEDTAPQVTPIITQPPASPIASADDDVPDNESPSVSTEDNEGNPIKSDLADVPHKNDDGSIEIKLH